MRCQFLPELSVWNSSFGLDRESLFSGSALVLFLIRPYTVKNGESPVSCRKKRKSLSSLVQHVVAWLVYSRVRCFLAARGFAVVVHLALWVELLLCGKVRGHAGHDNALGYI